MMVWTKLLMSPVLVLLLAGGAAGTADLRVRIDGVRNSTGQVLIAVCTRETFLQPRCEHAAATKARAGVTEFFLPGLAPGTYAVQAFHDENGNRDLDRNFLGWPREGMGFSRDAPMRAGPPEFPDAAVPIGPGEVTVAFRLRYF